MNCKSVSTLVNTNKKKSSLKMVQERMMRRDIGKQLAGCSISLIQGQTLPLLLAWVQVSTQPNKASHGAVKRILHYMAGTLDVSLQYNHFQEFGCFGHVDSNQIGSLDDRKSITSWVFNLGSGAIAQCSKKQEITTLSNIEAEYVAITSATCQGIWLYRLLHDMGVTQSIGHCNY